MDGIRAMQEQLPREARLLSFFVTDEDNLVEGAGAAGLAGLMSRPECFAGKTVGVILGGGNIDAETLRRVLSIGRPVLVFVKYLVSVEVFGSH